MLGMYAFILKNKRLLIILGVLLFMIWRNPSQKDFNNYKGIWPRRDAQFYIASIYTADSLSYIGILDNFIKVKGSKSIPIPMDTAKAAVWSPPPGDELVKPKQDSVDEYGASTKKPRADPLHILQKNN